MTTETTIVVIGMTPEIMRDLADWLRDRGFSINHHHGARHGIIYHPFAIGNVEITMEDRTNPQ